MPANSLVVISRGLSDEAGPGGPAREDEHRKGQASMAAMSRRGKHVIGSRSGHRVQIEQPELVIQTLEEVITAARR